MNYEQRLVAAAKCVHAYDSRLGEDPKLNPADFGVTATLKPHQIEGVSWLIKRYLIGVNVILGDEMGLGKTLQAISFLSYLKFIQKSTGPFLVICPLSVIDGWVSEISNFAPNLRVLSYIGDKEHRRDLRSKIYQQVNDLTSSNDVKSLPFDVLLSTYDIALVDQDFLSQFRWCFAVIDEAQRLKNPSSVLYNVLTERYLIPRTLLMTGTPIQNNLTELWALMHFCMPQVFGTLELFLSSFKEAGDPSGHDAEKVQKMLRSLKYVLGAFMLRRTKSKLIESGSLFLPPLTEITVMAPLVSLQRKVYVSILRKELPKLLSLASGASNAQSLQNIVIQLRKACSHPYLFPGIEPEPYEEGEHLVEASGKLVILDKVLQKLHKSGHRVLVFAQMTHTLDILQDYLELRKYSYERLDGSIRAEERFAAIRSFSHHQPSVGSSTSEAGHGSAFVFLISTRAGGVGLNLVAADTVIFYEQDWNPQVDKQALQRAHRIGQRNHVLSINLVTAQTVEEVIMRRAERKLLLSHNVIGDNTGDQEGNETTGAESGDLRSIILGLHKFDTAEICNEKSNQTDTDHLNEMVENIVSFRDKTLVVNDGKRFEINSKGLLNEQNSVPDSVAYDPGLDETSYRSWVEKFKDESHSDNDNIVLDVRNRRNVPPQETGHNKDEAAKKKAERKQSKWEELGYHSLTISDPVVPADSDAVISDSGVVKFLYGDCTHPVTESPTESTIIFSCIDNSGSWGRGGLFDALKNLSDVVPDAYERAHEFGDLHLGDLHLIAIKEEDGDEEGTGIHAKQWVALGVVQSYNNRRKVPRSDVSMPDFDQCLAKASFVAAQNSASIHMPRIEYQDGSDRSQWYTVERLLRKYAALYSVKIYVYYYRRPG